MRIAPPKRIYSRLCMKGLNHLLKKHVKWEWTRECEEAMTEAKAKLASAEVLVHYDSGFPLKLATDASPYGIGAVLSHEYPNGDDHLLHSP